MAEEGEILEEVALASKAAEELKDIIRDSYLDAEYDSKWHPAKVQLIHNKGLEAVYEEKREECLVRGRTSDELAEQSGFTVENASSVVQSVCASGFTTRDSDYNALGYSSMGVYLCRHADVCLSHAVVKYSGSPVIRLIVCKYMLGRHTTAIPRVASSADFIQPTQGFDCHVSVLPPSKSESLQSQFDRSQVYLYDINALLQPLLRPRQLLPYAIVTYTLDGVVQNIDDIEPLKTDIPPQLQNIIQRINAKADGQLIERAPGVDSLSRSQRISAQPIASSTVSVLGNIGDSVGTPKATGGVGLGSKTTVGSSGASEIPAAESPDANLQRVIAQINARLESQERGKQLAALQNVALMGGGSALPVASHSNVCPAPAGRAGGRNIVDPASLGGVLSAASSARIDPAGALGISPGSLGITPLSAAAPGHGGALAAPSQPKITMAANVAAVAQGTGGGGGGYVALAAPGARSAPFTLPADLVGTNVAALAGLQYQASGPIGSASYLRPLPAGVVDATVALDPTSAVLGASVPQQLKYVPYGSPAGRDVSVLGGGAAAMAGASSLYPLQSVVPGDTVGTGGYALVNSGGAVKRPLNDVMLYMVDKRPRYY